jgi:hypothetical protein
MHIIPALLSVRLLILQAFDTPENLMKDTTGYFARQMAEENSGML